MLLIARKDWEFACKPTKTYYLSARCLSALDVSAVFFTCRPKMFSFFTLVIKTLWQCGCVGQEKTKQERKQENKCRRRFRHKGMLLFITDISQLADDIQSMSEYNCMLCHGG